MSRTDDHDPIPGDPYSCAAVEQVIVPRARDLGGFAKRMEVRDPGGETVPAKGASDEGAEAGEGAERAN